MTLEPLVTVSNAVAVTRSRLEKVSLLAGLLTSLRQDEVGIAVAFLSGRIRQGRLGIGAAQLRSFGDLPPAGAPSLTLAEIDQAFGDLARTTGAGSQAARRARLGDLLAQATATEQDFLIRLLFGELRQGALEGVLLDAVARAAALPGPLIRRATMLAGDLVPVAEAALVDGAAGLDRFKLEVLRPVQPMLADSAVDIADALSRLQEAALEFKLDGARIQVHKAGDEIRVFSRSLNDVTAAVPEVVEQARRLPVPSAILDGEVLALKPDGVPHAFQVTMRRFGRRLNVEELRRELPLSPFYFDALLLDGHALVDEPQSLRFEKLRALLPAEVIVPHTTTRSLDEASAFVEAALARGHEGVMAKAPTSVYAAGSRGSAWLKVKAAHTLDLVVLAAEWGSGRRKGWLSNLHLGARDRSTGSFVMLGKTFKGLTDALLTWQTKRLLELETSRDGHIVYVRPELVVEIAFNDVQESPQYPGGMALRFARVKRYRDDKTVDEIDTVETVRRFLR